MRATRHPSRTQDHVLVQRVLKRLGRWTSPQKIQAELSETPGLDVSGALVRLVESGLVEERETGPDTYEYRVVETKNYLTPQELALACLVVDRFQGEATEENSTPVVELRPAPLSRELACADSRVTECLQTLVRLGVLERTGQAHLYLWRSRLVSYLPRGASQTVKFDLAVLERRQQYLADFRSQRSGARSHRNGTVTVVRARI